MVFGSRNKLHLRFLLFSGLGDSMNNDGWRRTMEGQPNRKYSSSVLLLLFLGFSCLPMLILPVSARDRSVLKENVRDMFYHAYDNYMQFAFPHDELKPLSKSYTDSLAELGNLNHEHLPDNYTGTALTLVESLSSLAVLGNKTEFVKAVVWLAENLSFDLDIRVNLFECNIRMLGGLISGHLLALDHYGALIPGGYKNQLLQLAYDLGRRLMPSFDTPTGIPYAWINLKNGVMKGETLETSTSGCGSLILEMGALSRLTGDPQFEAVALRALRKLWSLRSPLNLFGTTLNVATGKWIEHSTGIGAGVDSFYEYLLKAHILFGGDEYWDMFQCAYIAVQKYFRYGPWYHESDMRTGTATYWQLTSLQAFWPGVQVLIGDIAAANATHREFFGVWEKYGVMPERYLLDRGMIHPTERYYPLRPELAESTFYLYQATKDPWYLDVGERLLASLNALTRVSGGYASVRDVTTMELEDHQHSFFLSETCKYLYLLFDDSFLLDRNYVFSTEGHPLPVQRSWQQWVPFDPINYDMSPKKEPGKVGERCGSAMQLKVCPNFRGFLSLQDGTLMIESACHVLDRKTDHKCKSSQDCGIDASSCKRRTCSFSGYCGLWETAS